MTDQQRSDASDQFDALFDAHAPKVFRFALRAFRGDADMAQEIVQQVFTAVWQQFDRDFVDLPEHRVVPLIMRIAHCRVKDVWRQDKRRPLAIPEYAEHTVPLLGRPREFCDPMERILSDDELALFWQAVMVCLTDTEYRIALMAWELGMPDAEIASVLEKSVSTVYSHKSNARKKIQANLTESGVRIQFGTDDIADHTHGDRPGNGGEASA